jgi:hypothetical protein
MMTFVIITGCSNSEKADEYIFIATVLENNETHLLVEPEEGSAELSSADKIMVSVRDATLLNSQGSEIIIGDIKTGNKVEIAYNGEIAESYPAQVNKCYRVRILD